MLEKSAKINDLIFNLIEALREESPETTVSFNLFVNSEKWEVSTSSRTPDQLKDSGISMRNLRGEFIK